MSLPDYKQYTVNARVICTMVNKYSMQITHKDPFPALRVGEWWSMEFDVKVTFVYN